MKKIKKILFLFCILLVGICNVSAEPIVYERTNENLGVNKKEIDIDNSRQNILSTPLVDASYKVYDFSNVLSVDEQEDLRKRVNNFISSTNIDMVIVTVDKLWSDYEIEEFADDFFDYNDFGNYTSGTSYDGILVVRNTNDYNRYYYVSTSGLGQVYFEQDRINDILDDMYNNMHNDNYYQGFVDFIDSAYNNYLLGIPSKYKGATVDKYGELYDNNGHHISYEKGVYVLPILPALIIALIITIIIVLILVFKNKMVKKATRAKEYLDKNSINYTRNEDIFLHTHTTSYKITSDSSSGGGSHHSSSGMSHGGGGRHC